MNMVQRLPSAEARPESDGLSHCGTIRSALCQPARSDLGARSSWYSTWSRSELRVPSFPELSTRRRGVGRVDVLWELQIFRPMQQIRRFRKSRAPSVAFPGRAGHHRVYDTLPERREGNITMLRVCRIPRQNGFPELQTNQQLPHIET